MDSHVANIQAIQEEFQRRLERLIRQATEEEEEEEEEDATADIVAAFMADKDLEEEEEEEEDEVVADFVNNYAVMSMSMAMARPMSVARSLPPPLFVPQLPPPLLKVAPADKGAARTKRRTLFGKQPVLPPSLATPSIAMPSSNTVIPPTTAAAENGEKLEVMGRAVVDSVIHLQEVVTIVLPSFDPSLAAPLVALAKSLPSSTNGLIAAARLADSEKRIKTGSVRSHLIFISFPFSFIFFRLSSPLFTFFPPWPEGGKTGENERESGCR